VVVERGKQLKLKLEHPEIKSPGETKNLIKQASVQQEKAIEELQSKIDQLLQKEAKTPETADSHKRVDNLLRDIKNELGKLKEHLHIPENREALPKEVKNDIDTLLKNLDNTLKKLPEGDTARISQRLAALAKTLGNLRTGLESGREFQEIKEQIVKQVSQLKSEVENSNLDVTVKKGVEALVAKLSGAADKINQLKTPDQMPELRRVISEDIKPNLTALQEMMNRQETPAGTAADHFSRNKTQFNSTAQLFRPGNRGARQ
jgi:DNA repair ATPase RecN